MTQTVTQHGHLILKSVILLCLWCLPTGITSQEKSDIQNHINNNELKLNAGYLFAGGFLETSYERILNEESAVGLSLGYAFDKSID